MSNHGTICTHVLDGKLPESVRRDRVTWSATVCIESQLGQLSRVSTCRGWTFNRSGWTVWAPPIKKSRTLSNSVAQLQQRQEQQEQRQRRLLAQQSLVIKAGLPNHLLSSKASMVRNLSKPSGALWVGSNGHCRLPLSRMAKPERKRASRFPKNVESNNSETGSIGAVRHSGSRG